MALFEQIINPSIFKPIIDDILKDWPGPYEVVSAEKPLEPVYPNYEKHTEFCKLLAKSTVGRQRCRLCDQSKATEAAAKRAPIWYVCHAGLIDIVAPIVVEDNLIASIFCGQCIVNDRYIEEEGLAKTRDTELELGFSEGTLLTLREKIPRVSQEKIDLVINKLSELTNFVSSIGADKLEANKARHELKYRLDDSEARLEVMQTFTEVITDEQTLWRRTEAAMEVIRKRIEAEAVLLITSGRIIGQESILLKASTSDNLKSGNVYTGCSPAFIQAADEKGMSKLAFASIEGARTFCRDVACLTENRVVEDAILFPVALESGSKSLLVFVFSKRIDDVNNKAVIINELSQQITFAHANYQLYKNNQWYADIRKQWLESISHQIVSPLNEIIGQAENLSKHFRTWVTEKPERIDNALESLLHLSVWAGRIASNFAWIARDRSLRSLQLREENDLTSCLIAYARSVQGMAHERGLLNVSVLVNEISKLNGLVRTDRKHFHQAVSNLLDNAVKYSFEKTEITISGFLSDNNANIEIINYGIRIREEDCERIFERDYRTTAAKEKDPIGTGMGLPIARDIIHAHRGTLIAKPSEKTHRGWKSVFVISLPIIKK